MKRLIAKERSTSHIQESGFHRPVASKTRKNIIVWGIILFRFIFAHLFNPYPLNDHNIPIHPAMIHVNEVSSSRWTLFSISL